MYAALLLALGLQGVQSAAPRGNPAADALAARERSFEGYSAEPLGFVPDGFREFVRFDEVDGGKALHCERRSGSRKEIKRAYRRLVSLFKSAFPKDWKLQEESDVLNAYPPGANTSVAVGIAWTDRRVHSLNRALGLSRSAPPSREERYVLTLDVFPP